VTGDLSKFAPEAEVIHIDTDPAEINKVRRARWGSSRREERFSRTSSRW